MKKLFAVVVILLFYGVQVFGKSNSNYDLKSMISIEIDGIKTSLQNRSDLYLYSEKFNLIFEGLKEDQAICIYDGTDASYENKYKLPVKADDTDIFAGGCGLAEKPYKEGSEYYLSVTDPYSFHYITADRRINTSNGAIIKISGITDPTNTFKGDLYFLIYVDFNENKTIERNELVFLSLHFPLYRTSSELDFSNKNRGYFSTVGFSLPKESRRYTGKDFKVYKIRSKNDFLKVCILENKNFSGTNLETVFRYYFDNMDYNANTFYICFIPQGYNQIGNCFRLKGSSSVYLEYIKSLPEEDKSVNIRCFYVSSSNPDPEIVFYSDGKLVKTNIISF